MRIAIFSDVHGNLTALDAVLDDIAQQEVDQSVFAGDLCLLGPRPAVCLQRLRAAEIAGVYGNTDDWVLGRQPAPERVRALAEWTREQLSEEAWTWLDALPFSHAISPTEDESRELLVVHANPRDVNTLIFPPEKAQRERWGRMRQSDNKLKPLLSDVTAEILAFGHLHIPNERHVAGKRLINISSVSIPGDDDPRAKYGLFSWNGEQWDFERRYVPYNVTAEIDAYRTAQPPGWENIVRTLEETGYYPQNV